MKSFVTQESPPVGNRKRRTACGIICYSVNCLGVPHSWLEGTPSWPGWGVPHPDLAGGHSILIWRGVGTPLWGTPCLDSGTEVPPRRDLGPVTRVPPDKDMGPVEVLWDGDEVPPWTDTHLWKHNLPSYYVCGRVKSLKISNVWAVSCTCFIRFALKVGLDKPRTLFHCSPPWSTKWLIGYFVLSRSI